MIGIVNNKSFIAGISYKQVFAAMVLVFFTVDSFSQNRADRRQIDQIEEYCVGCHNFEDYSGSFDL